MKSRSHKLPLQLLQTVSSSVSFLIFPNSLVRFWILYLWVKCNPKNSILQINAVQCVYVEICYNIFTSKYKKLNYNIDISNLSDLPFDGICFFLEKWSWWYSAKITNDRYVSQNICTVFFLQIVLKTYRSLVILELYHQLHFSRKKHIPSRVSQINWKYQYYNSIFCILM